MKLWGSEQPELWLFMAVLIIHNHHPVSRVTQFLEKKKNQKIKVINGEILLNASIIIFCS